MQLLGGAFGFLTEGGPGASPLTYESWSWTVPQQDMWPLNNSFYDYHCANPEASSRGVSPACLVELIAFACCDGGRCCTTVTHLARVGFQVCCCASMLASLLLREESICSSKLCDDHTHIPSGLVPQPAVFPARVERSLRQRDWCRRVLGHVTGSSVRIPPRNV